MAVNDLKEKVDKSSEKVNKIKSTIERHKKQLEKKVAALQKLGVEIDLNDVEAAKRDQDGNAVEYYYEICDIKSKQEDIKNAHRKLSDAEEILARRERDLNLALEKERFLHNNAPQVIKDFLEEWKNKAYEWHVRKYKSFPQYYKNLKQDVKDAKEECVKTSPEYVKYLDENGEIIEYYRSSYQMSNLRPRKPMDNYLDERGLSEKYVQQRLLNYAGATVLKMNDMRDEEKSLAWLNKQLEEEKKWKMLDLINRIHDVVGKIIDAQGLRIGGEGNLNGVIIGEKGKVTVRTIGAGGYNIQCFHFRTLVQEMKNDEKN